MQLIFNLCLIIKEGPASIPVLLPMKLDKSFQEIPISSHRGYNGRRINMINVLPAEGIEKINSVSDIQMVVGWQDLETMYEMGQTSDGKPKYVTVNKKSIQAMYPNSTNLTVSRTVRLSDIPPCHYDGGHYFMDLYCKKQGKVRIDNPEHKQLYRALHAHLKTSGLALIVRYVTSNRPHIGVVYATNECIRMSGLIDANFQRERHPDLLPLTEEEKAIGPLLTGNIQEYIPESTDYMERLRATLASAEKAYDEAQNKAKPQDEENKEPNSALTGLLQRLKAIPIAQPQAPKPPTLMANLLAIRARQVSQEPKPDSQNSPNNS
jgi:hypothetical protein